MQLLIKNLILISPFLAPFLAAHPGDVYTRGADPGAFNERDLYARDLDLNYLLERDLSAREADLSAREASLDTREADLNALYERDFYASGLDGHFLQQRDLFAREADLDSIYARDVSEGDLYPAFARRHAQDFSFKHDLMPRAKKTKMTATERAEYSQMKASYTEHKTEYEKEAKKEKAMPEKTDAQKTAKAQQKATVLAYWRALNDIKENLTSYRSLYSDAS
ncbi:hypothetical protein MMC18_006788 [Xylographa bjoerkii]|nr:hypothetical protein [Xylographa bjoerkii]